MSDNFPCPYFDGVVELTEEREKHIAAHHPDLLPEYRGRIGQTLAEPDRIVRSSRFGSAYLFSRWYDDINGGKHVVVVTVTEGGPKGRHWIITAYLTEKLAGGDIVWARN